MGARIAGIQRQDYRCDGQFPGLFTRNTWVMLPVPWPMLRKLKEVMITRFMKSIVMPPLEKMPCLRCFGETIDTWTAAKPGELYLQDKAGGYLAGPVRGAFTL